MLRVKADALAARVACTSAVTRTLHAQRARCAVVPTFVVCGSCPQRRMSRTLSPTNQPQVAVIIYQFICVLIGEGGDVPVSFDFEALQRTATFVATPHLLAVMGSIERGRHPHRALPGAVPEQIDAAIQRLLDVGAARKIMELGDRPVADAGEPVCPLVLTGKGRRVLELIRDLRRPAAGGPMLADGEGLVGTSDQLTEW